MGAGVPKLGTVLTELPPGGAPPKLGVAGAPKAGVVVAVGGNSMSTVPGFGAPGSKPVPAFGAPAQPPHPEI